MKSEKKHSDGAAAPVGRPVHITLKEIAKRAGVSLTTASFVLNGKGRIAPATCERVRKIAEECHYAPNFHARAMLSGRTYLVGMLVPSIDTSFIGKVIGACTEELARNNYYLLVAEHGDKEEKELRAFEFMARLGVDGFIYAPPQKSDTTRHGYGWGGTATGKPVVSVLAQLPGMPGVLTDHESGIRMLGDCLWQNGHRRIAYYGYRLVPGGSRINERFELFNQYFAARGGSVMPFTDPEELLAHRREFTAVACFYDELAADLIRRLTAAGLRVPEDLSVTGYGHDALVEKLLQPQLTTVVEMKREIGTAAAQLLLALLESRDPAAVETRRLPPTFRNGASVCPITPAL